jgi:hypothetical protein
MSKKYHTAPTSTILTNDLFLAAFLSSVGCTLDRIEKNERRRVSFVFVGERVRELREAYRTGPVKLDMRIFRENLNTLRDRVSKMVAQYHPEERSAYRGPTGKSGQLRIPTYAHA